MSVGFDYQADIARSLIGTRDTTANSLVNDGFISFWEADLPLITSGIRTNEPDILNASNANKRIGYINSPVKITNPRIISTKTSGRKENGEPNVFPIPNPYLELKVSGVVDVNDMELLRYVESLKYCWLNPVNWITPDTLFGRRVELFNSDDESIGWRYGSPYPYPFYFGSVRDSSVSESQRSIIWRLANIYMAMLGTFNNFKHKPANANSQDTGAYEVEIMFTSAIDYSRHHLPYQRNVIVE